MVQAEAVVQEIVCTFLSGVLAPRYRATMKAPLLYELVLDADQRIHPEADSTGKIVGRRGSHAFETDILIEDDRRPLVVLELKVGFTTHDVLTYSAKAERHKQVYPYLRYGLLIAGQPNVEPRFFTHNDHLDFVLAATLKDDIKSDLNKILDVVRAQIECAETLVRISQKCKLSRYETRVVIEEIA